MTQEMTELDVIVTETNEIAVTEPIKAALVAELGGVADKLQLYATAAESMVVTSQDDAEECAIKEAEIQEAIKLVKGSEVLTKITDGLHKMHRRWTGFRKVFTEPLEASKKTLRAKRIAWEDEQRAAAEKERKRLQAIEDERVKREQEALLKKAEKAKRPETKERILEQAETVTATEIRVEAPKTSGRRTTKWSVAGIDEAVFYQAAATDTMLQGYIEIKVKAMERSKAANPNLSLPGVEFKKVTK